MMKVYGKTFLQPEFESNALFNVIMDTRPTSPPQSDGQSEATSKRSRTTTQLRTLTLRTVDQPRPAFYVDPAIGRASGPMRENFHSYLGVVAREKVPIIHNTWKDVLEMLEEIVWNDILAKFDIAEAPKVKTKVMSTVATRWRQFKSTLTSKFVFAKSEGCCDKYGLDPEAWKQFEETRLTPNWEGIRKRAQSIKKYNDCPHVLSRGGYDLLEKKLLDEKRKRIQEEALLSDNPASLDDPPSPIKRHVKWKVAQSRAVGNMTSESAQEIEDKILSSPICCSVHMFKYFVMTMTAHCDSLEEQVTQGSFVPHGRQDILNTAIGRPDHGGHVRAAGSGVTITQYYGRVSRTSSNSSTSISQQQLDEVVARLREDMTELRTQIKEELRTQLEEENKRSLEIMTKALKEAIKKELSNKGSPELLQIQPDIQQLGARVSTKGSNVVINVQPSQEHHVDAIPLMGLYVQRKDGTLGLVAMGKIMEGDSIIHTVAYADDVVRVSVETVIDPEAEVPYATSEIQYVKQVVDTFVAWPTHLVKAVLDEDPESISHNEDAHVPKSANVDADDPLRGLIKYSCDIYDKPVEINFAGSCFGIVDAPTSIFITYSDVSEIIAGDKSLNISVLQLWLMYMHEWSQIFSQGSMYAFLEPQSLVVSKDTRSECQQYLERWLKESDREVYIGPYFHHVMTKLKTTLSPETKAVAPKWIEVKSHVQTGCYECGYYIMHWMWNIITSDIKSDWSMWFVDETPLDIDNITTIRKKWATYFLKTTINVLPRSFPLQQLSERMKCPRSLDGCLVEGIIVFASVMATLGLEILIESASQVILKMILSFDLAFALIPLLKFTSSKMTSSTSIEEVDCRHANGRRPGDENYDSRELLRSLSDAQGSGRFCTKVFTPTTTGAQTTGVETSKNNDGRRVTRGMRVPRNEYARSRHQREVVAAQLAQASQVASSRSNSLLEEYSGGPKWAWVLFAPPFLLSTPPSAQKNVYTDNHSGISAYHRARRLWMIQGCRMTKLGLCLSSGPPPLDDKRVRITVRMTKFGLCLSSGPPPLDDKRVRITVRMTKFGLCLSSGPPPLDDKRVRITVRMTKLGLCLSSGPPPLDDKRVRITVRYLRVSSGPPPLDDTRSPTVATYPSAGGRRVTRGMRVPRKEYARSRHQRKRRKNRKRRNLRTFLSERFGSCIYARGRGDHFKALDLKNDPFYLLLINSIKNEKSQRENVRLIFRFILLKDNDEERMKNVEERLKPLRNSSRKTKIGEVVAAQLAQASSARPGEPGCFLQKQQPSGGIFWRAQVGLGAICTPIFTKYTPSAVFW
ncbi:hypothetical protein HKD37_16G045569 [Glycine soja]